MDAIIFLTQCERQINVLPGTENWANNKQHDIYSLGIPKYRATSGKILIENSLRTCDDVHCYNCIRISQFDFQYWNQGNFVPLDYA